MRVESKGSSEPTPRHMLGHEAYQTPHEWAQVAAERRWRPFAFLSKFSPLEILFAGSIIFVVAAGFISALLVFSGSNTVSTRNVSVSVVGPTSVRAGEEVTLQVIVTNQNAVPMNLTDLLVEYPPGTRSPLDVSIELPRSRESLGTIEPGESVNRTVKAVMFGTAGDSLAVSVIAEYRVPSSNAVFQSATEYRTTVSQSPATIAVESLSEVVSGQETQLVVVVESNASENLTGMLLTATYPPGFKFVSSTPKPLGGSTVWDLGDIEPSGSRKVIIRGSFTGEDGDDRVVHFTAGTKKREDPTALAAPLAANDVVLKIAKPFISVQLALNGVVRETASVARGSQVKVEARWSNNLPVRIQDVEIQVKLSGSILNKSSVRTGQGFYRSSDNTVIFNKGSDPRLADLEPGATGESTFEFGTFPVGQGSYQSPTVELRATVSGNRSSEGGVVDTVASSAETRVTVETDLALSSVLTRVLGPVPPKVETETVYTVTWLLNNSANAIANTVLTATLPDFVVWKGAASSGAVSYNENNRTLTWTIGDMNANTTQSLFFNVSVTPSVTQLHQVVPLVENIRISAFDRFIRQNIERPMPAVTTQTGTGPIQGSVVP